MSLISRRPRQAFRGDGLPQLHEQHSGGLLLDAELPSEQEGRLVLDRVHRQRDGAQHPGAGCLFP